MEDEGGSLVICEICGKRIAEGRKGSFTQWVFRAETCSCKAPVRKEAARDSLPEPAAAPPVQVKNVLLDNLSFEQRYEEMEVLGQGASGKVLLCRDLVLKKPVAVKIASFTNEKQTIAFQQEARATSRLHHPNIVKVIDFGAADGLPYIVMEHVNGITLKRHIMANGPLDQLVAAGIFSHIADALAHAHAMGVLHRDITSANVILFKSTSGSLDATLIDFGVAALKYLTPEGDNPATAGTALVGSPLYMAPDQAAGKPYDARSEIYSLGCVLFEALTGKTPFAGESALETLSMHAQKMPPALSEIRPHTEFSPDLEKLVGTCLSKEPDNRFQTMEELSQSLASIEYGGVPPVSIGQDVSEDKKGLSTQKLAATICGFLLLAATSSLVLFTQPEEPPQAPKRETEEAGPGYTQYSPADSKKLNLSTLVLQDQLYGLKVYRQAEEINLSDNSIDDEVFNHINTPYLKKLNLTSTNVRTLKGIDKLSNLTQLNLQDTKVTDDSLTELAKLPMLQVVNLQDSGISDEGLRNLESVPTLELVFLKDSIVSPSSAQALSRRMPACSFDPYASAPLLGVQTRIHALCGANQNQEALRLANQSIKLVEKVQGTDAPLLARYLILAALAYSRLGKDADADRVLARAAEISRRRKHDILLADALSWRVRNEYKQFTHRYARSALLERPPTTESDLARVKELEGFLPRSEEICKILTRIHGPNSGQVYLQKSEIARIYSYLGQIQKSREICDEIISATRVAEMNEPLTNSLYHEAAGHALAIASGFDFETRQLARAESGYRKAIDEFTRTTDYKNNASILERMAACYAALSIVCEHRQHLQDAITAIENEIAIRKQTRLHPEERLAAAEKRLRSLKDRAPRQTPKTP